MAPNEEYSKRIRITEGRQGNSGWILVPFFQGTQDKSKSLGGSLEPLEKKDG